MRKRSVSAMFIAIVIASLALAAFAAFASTIAALPKDGYRPIPTDRTRLP